MKFVHISDIVQLHNCSIIKAYQGGTERAGDTMEVNEMTDKQSERLENLARLDELERLKHLTTDRETLERIAEREKALRAALDKPLNA